MTKTRRVRPHTPGFLPPTIPPVDPLTSPRAPRRFATDFAARELRLAAVNELIGAIACHGRCFFVGKNGVISTFELDARGRVWIIDKWRGDRVYTHNDNGRWRGFSEGGTLRHLCRALRDYITRGTPVPSNHFGPWPQWICDGDPWGYGADMQIVRDIASRLGIVASRPAEQSVPA